MLAEEVGMTAADAEPALAAFDSFFPIADGGSWHAPSSGVDLLKFFPAAMHGIGVFHRLHRSGLYRRDETGHVHVAQVLRDEYGASEEAAATMRTWYDAGAATLLRTLS